MLRQVAKTAQHARIGVWSRDRTHAFRLRGLGSIGPYGALILPKIFRRCVRFSEAKRGGFVGPFRDWLRSTSGEDDRMYAPARFTRLSDALKVCGEKVGLRSDVDALVFRQAPYRETLSLTRPVVIPSPPIPTSDATQDAMLEAALRLAATAWDLPGLTSILNPEERNALLGWKNLPAEWLPNLIVELEERSPRVTHVLEHPGLHVELSQALMLSAARSTDPRPGTFARTTTEQTAYRGDVPAPEHGAALASRDDFAAGCALVAVAAMSRERGNRDMVAIAAARAVALFASAARSESGTMLNIVRECFGWSDA